MHKGPRHSEAPNRLSRNFYVSKNTNYDATSWLQIYSNCCPTSLSPCSGLRSPECINVQHFEGQNWDEIFSVSSYWDSLEMVTSWSPNYLRKRQRAEICRSTIRLAVTLQQSEWATKFSMTKQETQKTVCRGSNTSLHPWGGPPRPPVP